MERSFSRMQAVLAELAFLCSRSWSCSSHPLWHEVIFFLGITVPFSAFSWHGFEEFSCRVPTHGWLVTLCCCRASSPSSAQQKKILETSLDCSSLMWAGYVIREVHLALCRGLGSRGIWDRGAHQCGGTSSPSTTQQLLRFYESTISPSYNLRTFVKRVASES